VRALYLGGHLGNSGKVFLVGDHGFFPLSPVVPPDSSPSSPNTFFPFPFPKFPSLHPPPPHLVKLAVCDETGRLIRRTALPHRFPPDGPSSPPEQCSPTGDYVFRFRYCPSSGPPYSLVPFMSASAPYAHQTTLYWRRFSKALFRSCPFDTGNFSGVRVSVFKPLKGIPTVRSTLFAVDPRSPHRCRLAIFSL